MASDFVAVPREAIDWLKMHFPALTVKAGLCESIAGRLYTRTQLPATEVASPVVRRKVADVAIDAIRQLIACHDERTCPAIDVANQALAALATPSQQEDAQPVGEIVGTEKRGFGSVTVVRWELGFDREKIGTLLYTRATPPARSSVPLTSEQIEKERGAAYSNPDFEAGVRYAEAAHGIVSPQSPQEREG